MGRLCLSAADRVYRKRRQEEFQINPPSQYRTGPISEAVFFHSMWLNVDTSHVSAPASSSQSPSPTHTPSVSSPSPDVHRETPRPTARTYSNRDVPRIDRRTHAPIVRDYLRRYHAQRRRVPEEEAWQIADHALQQDIDRQAEEERRWAETAERRRRRRCDRREDLMR